MLRKEAIIRAAMVTHVTKMLKSGVLTVNDYWSVPPAVIYLSLKRLHQDLKKK